MKNILTHPGYFSPIVQYAAIVQAQKYTFEIQDHFQKQTYRSRCYIYSPNGKQLLTVPIQHAKTGLKTMAKEVKIDYATAAWQKIHLKSFEASYRSSPFFEFYEDELKNVLSKKQTFLLDLQLEAHAFVMEALELNPDDYAKTQNFEKEILAMEDLRNLVNAKATIGVDFPSYVQVFDEKFGFLKNLSILDLLFMKGPSSVEYLQKIAFHKPLFETDKFTKIS